MPHGADGPGELADSKEGRCTPDMDHRTVCLERELWAAMAGRALLAMVARERRDRERGCLSVGETENAAGLQSVKKMPVTEAGGIRMLTDEGDFRAVENPAW